MRDDITTSIDIHSDLHRVWTLVSEPGWWINTGTLGGHRIEQTDDGCIVHDDDLGAFPVGVVALEEPHRAVFTWQPGGDDVPRTTVEFTVSEAGPGTVTVTVVESGFGRMTEQQHERNYEENESGWRDELALALTVLELPLLDGSEPVRADHA